ncbi:hypothetical protein F0A17_13880 [Billgrantia pellis]|uniref:Integrase n=1 Tax=Billgrantia pellis TaxID=2606936 RepID=A0A7V7KHG6_9GAMM|nr:hypothetical protein F0A17_13880 [Halomonas pellis]
MATIVKRPRKGGSFSYQARIRIARRGQPDFTESRTFPKKAMAEEWAKRRELELMQPGGILTAKWRGVRLTSQGNFCESPAGYTGTGSIWVSVRMLPLRYDRSALLG